MSARQAACDAAECDRYSDEDNVAGMDKEFGNLIADRLSCGNAYLAT